MSHLYEIVLESEQLWIKFQASCTSSEQALAFLEHRLGGEDPNPPVPVYPYFTFEIPTKLSERVGRIANWEAREGRVPRRLGRPRVLVGRRSLPVVREPVGRLRLLRGEG